MTLLEVPEVRNVTGEEWTAGAGVAAADIQVRGVTARRYRGVRNAGFARLDDLERRVLTGVAAVEIGPNAALALTRHLEAFFSEARSLLAEQIAELDHCLKQAYGVRPSAETPVICNSGFDRLTGAEKRVFAELAKGKPNKIIAFDLAISEATVKAHVSKILKKLKVHSRNRAIAMFAAKSA